MGFRFVCWSVNHFLDEFGDLHRFRFGFIRGVERGVRWGGVGKGGDVQRGRMRSGLMRRVLPIRISSLLFQWCFSILSVVS